MGSEDGWRKNDEKFSREIGDKVRETTDRSQ